MHQPPNTPPTPPHAQHSSNQQRGCADDTLVKPFYWCGSFSGNGGIKKKATIWLAHQGEVALIYLECVEISFPPPCCHEPGESWAATVTDICNTGRGGRLSCFRFLVLEEAGGGGASREGPRSKWVKIAPLAGAPAPLAKLSQRRSVSSWVRAAVRQSSPDLWLPTSETRADADGRTSFTSLFTVCCDGIWRVQPTSGRAPKISQVCEAVRLQPQGKNRKGEEK